jgi:hypothetical protein
LWDHSPQAAAWTAIADCEQLGSWADTEPDSIQFISANHVNQSSSLSPSHMFQRFIHGYTPSKLGVYALGCFTQKKTAKIDWMFLASLCPAANTFVHDPMDVGTFDEVTDDL